MRLGSPWSFGQGDRATYRYETRGITRASVEPVKDGSSGWWSTNLSHAVALPRQLTAMRNAESGTRSCSTRNADRHYHRKALI